MATPSSASPQNAPDVAIVGAGGVGGLLAALLGRAGVRVTLYVRPGRAVAGLPPEMRVRQGQHVLSAPVAWSNDWVGIAAADVTLVAVKAWQVAEVCQRLQIVQRAGTTVLTLQNGLRAPELVADAVPQAEVLAGVCDVRCWRDGPGLVTWLGDTVTVMAGPLRARWAPTAAAVTAVLAAAGITATVAPDMRAALWTKLAFISAFGGVGALAGLPVGEVRATPNLRELQAAVAAEVVAVARAAGVSLPDDATAAALRRLDALPAAATASMQRDLAAGVPSELDDLLGEVVRRAAALHVAVPTCAQIAAKLEPAEAVARRLAAGASLTSEAAPSSASAAASSGESPARARTP